MRIGDADTGKMLSRVNGSLLSSIIVVVSNVASEIVKKRVCASKVVSLRRLSILN